MSVTKSKTILDQISVLSGTLTEFSFEELSMEDAKSLKKTFDIFRKKLERHIFSPDSMEVADVQENLTPKEKQVASSHLNLLAQVSHEIRTPLNGIIGFSNLLQEDNLTLNQLKKVNAIQSASNNLMGIINEILEFAKLSSGTDSFEKIDFNIHALVNDVIFLGKTLLMDKNVDLDYTIDANVPKVLNGDPSKLSQILLNLLGNAIKFVKKGSIKLKIDVDSFKEQQYQLQFSVIDTGIGIPKDKLDTIFSSYNEASKITNASYGGTGLGLSIVKEIVVQQKGSIYITSKVGSGTTITFVIPFVKGNQKNITKKMHNDIGGLQGKELLKGTKIMVFEDNSLNQHLIAEQLKKWDCDVHVTDKIHEGLAFLDSNPLDIILMDLKMPEMSGFEVSQLIRAKGNMVPIIAFSADFTAEDQVLCNRSGINDFLLKPYSIELLLSKLLKNKQKENLSPDSMKLLKSESIVQKFPITVDLETILKDCFDDMDMLQELIKLFKQNVLEFIGNVKIHLDNLDLQQVSFSAHKLKASLAMIKANELRELMIQMEINCKANEEQEVKMIYDQFISGYALLEKEIDLAVAKLKKK